MSVVIRKIALYAPGREPSGRARTGEAILVTRDRSPWSTRYEFDYDDNNIYVYCSYWTSGICRFYGDVRAIPRKKA